MSPLAIGELVGRLNTEGLEFWNVAVPPLGRGSDTSRYT